MKSGRTVFILLLILLSLMVIALTVPKKAGKEKSSQPAAAKPSGKPYTVISQKDIGTLDRSRYQWRIVAPDARTLDERARTAMKAAEELRQKQMVKVAIVFLEPDQASAGQGNALAIAVFASDGKGFSGVENKKWEVTATDEKPELAASTRIKYKDE